jgi:hypothetical protein
MNCRQLVQLVDLCLLRCVELHCQRVLPYGIRQLIKDFLIVALNNATIREAVTLWCESHQSLWSHLFVGYPPCDRHEQGV